MEIEESGKTAFGQIKYRYAVKKGIQPNDTGRTKADE